MCDTCGCGNVDNKKIVCEKCKKEDCECDNNGCHCGGGCACSNHGEGGEPEMDEMNNNPTPMDPMTQAPAEPTPAATPAQPEMNSPATDTPADMGGMSGDSADNSNESNGGLMGMLKKLFRS
ncbi:MAG: hypothetical protein ACOZAO_02415 [Patescibacteria group bacterium]